MEVTGRIRSRSSSSAPSKRRRPWSMTMTRLQSVSMSARSCVVRSTVVPSCRLISCRNSRTFALATMSRPIVGSSRKSRGGRCSSEAARSQRIRSPSESLRTGWWRYAFKPRTLSKSVHPLAVLRLGQPVDLLEQAERLDDRDVPPELRPLAEDHADRRDVAGALAVRHEAVAHDLARGRRQDAGQHLDRGRLAGAVGPDVADHLARLRPRT